MQTIKIPIIVGFLLILSSCSIFNKQKEEKKITLESGLSYVIIKKGEGEKPTINDKVKTHYHGTLPDGTVFDSSYDRGQPATFPLNRVIKGWQEGIPLMSKGAIYRFYIPAKLAYGSRGAGKSIGPNQDLIFKVELLDIIK
ncbi:MAG: FKBP-type peptidyl-prolyl cis-trans isomerase [Flavobacteriales bacterium]